MKINVDNSIIYGDFSKDDSDFYRRFAGKNTSTFDEKELLAYNEGLSKCSDGFRDLYGQAEKAGVQLEFVKDLNEKGDTVYRLSDKALKQIDKANMKYREGTTAAKLYAKAQEIQADAAYKAAVASKKAAAEAESNAKINQIDKWAGQEFTQEDISAEMAFTDSANAAAVAKVTTAQLTDEYYRLSDFLHTHDITPDYETGINGAKVFSKKTLAEFYKVEEYRKKLLSTNFSDQDTSDAIEYQNNYTPELRKLEILKKMRPEMLALIQLSDQLGVKLQFKDPIKGMSELDDATKENLNVTKKVDSATIKATAAGKAHNAMLAMKAGLYKGAAKAASLFGFESLKELGQMALLTVGISLAVKGIQKLWSIMPTQNHLLEWAEESANALQETRDEIDSTTSELESIQERMTELQNMGALSLTEQEELRNLQQQNAELEKKLALLQKTEEVEAREASKDAVKALHSYDEEYNVTNYGGNSASPNKTVADQLNEYAARYREIKAEMADLDLSDPDAQEKWEDLNTEAEEYEKKITDLSNNAQTQLDNIDISTLDGETADYVNSVSNAITGSLQAIGAISTSDALKLQLPDGQYDYFIQQMQALADSEQEVTESSLKQYLGEDIYNAAVTAYGGIDALIEHIKSLRGVDGIVEKVASSDDFAGQDIQGKIGDMINDKDFLITAESITKVLGEDFVKACEEAGTSAEAMAEKWNQARQDMADHSITGVIGDLNNVEDSLKVLSDAYNSFATDGKVTGDVLSNIAEKFKSLEGTPEFSDALATIGNSSSSIKDVENALSKLGSAYISSTNVLDGLNEQHKELYVNRLKEMGVTNAEAMVEHQLQAAKLTTADSTEAEKDAAVEHIDTLLNETNELYNNASATLTAAEKLSIFTAYQQMAAGNNFAEVVTSHANALLLVAKAGGPAASALYNYVMAVQAISQIQGMATKGKFGNILKSGMVAVVKGAAAALEESAKSALTSFASPGANFSYSPSGFGPDGGSDSGGGGGGSDSGNSASDKRKNKYDEEKAKLDHKLEMEYISYKTYYKKLDALGKKYLKGRKGNVKDYKEHLETLADVRKSAFDAYKKQLDTSLDKGKISYDKYYKKVVALGKKWLKGKKGNKEDYQEYINDLIEIRRNAFKAGQEDLDKALEKQDISIETYYSKSKKLQKKWLAGRDSTKKDLLESIEELFDQIKDYYEELMDKVSENNEIKTFYKTWVPGENEVTAWEDYIEKIDKAQLKGMLRWEDWYDMRFKAEKELADAKKEAYEFEKDNIDNIIDLVSDMLKQEKEDMIDALNDQKDKYAEIVDAKKEALDLTRAQLDYEKEIRDLNRDLSEMQSKAAVLRLDTSREGQAKYKALMEEIRAKQEEIAEKQDEHTYDASIEALDESLEEYEEKLEKKIEDIEELMNHQGEWLKYVYSYINSTDPSTMLNRLVGYNDQYGTGIAADVHDMWANYENVRNKYLGEKIEDIIAAIREAAKAAENGSSEEIDYDGDGVPDDSANYEYIGQMILQMEKNLERMDRLKGVDTEAARNELERLKESNLLISHKISDTSSGLFDDLDHNKAETEWYTKTGANLFDMIAHGKYVPETEGKTAVSVINMMKKETDKNKRNLLAKDLRTIHGYENVFYDYDTGYWYKNVTDYKNQKALFDKEGNSGALVSMPQTLTETIDSIKKAMSKGSWGSNSLDQLVKALRKYSGYGNAWYDPSTKHVYRNATDFYNLQTVDAGKVGSYKHAAASRIINAMKSSGSADVNNALASILKKNFSAYKDLSYDKKSKKWKYTKNKKKVNLYHTGIDAGFVSDGSYLPSPKQSELYALLQKGELVLNKTDQDRLMVQMQVLSSLQDSIKKMTQTASAPAGISSQPIVINLDQPIIINGNADKSTVDLLKKQSQAITNQTLNTLQDALKMRGFNGRVQSNRK